MLTCSNRPTSHHVTKLISHYHDLTRAHDTVLTAKAQVEALAPIVTDLDVHAAAESEARRLRGLRDALRAHVVVHKLALLHERVTRRESERSRVIQRRQQTSDLYDRAQLTLADLRTAISTNGGDRLSQLDVETEQARARRDTKRQAAEHFGQLCTQLGLEPPTSQAAFETLASRLAEAEQQTAARRAEIENRQAELAVASYTSRERSDAVRAELAGLERRTSNIDERVVGIRTALCEQLGIEALRPALCRRTDPGRRPDVGTGGRAADARLRPLAAGARPAYTDVSRWVDETNLRGRLVFYRLRSAAPTERPGDERSLVHKLDVRPGLAASAWVTAEVVRRFDVVCARTTEEFLRASRAVTRNGQVKGTGNRHEKDDRYPLGDRRRYVLGWRPRPSGRPFRSSSTG